jgi:hypothetical protein
VLPGFRCGTPWAPLRDSAHVSAEKGGQHGRCGGPPAHCFRAGPRPALGTACMLPGLGANSAALLLALGIRPGAGRRRIKRLLQLLWALQVTGKPTLGRAPSPLLACPPLGLRHTPRLALPASDIGQRASANSTQGSIHHHLPIPPALSAPAPPQALFRALRSTRPPLTCWQRAPTAVPWASLTRAHGSS